jgi:hypothetical protein
MHSQDDSSRSVPTPPSAFTPAYLEQVQGEDDELTATEAELSGPWKVESLPGHPKAVAVLRLWERPEAGDLPAAVFNDKQTAALCALAFTVVGREPLYFLSDQPAPAAPLPGGHPLTAVYGQQGPQVAGWLRCYNREVATALHLFEAVLRSPYLLAQLLRIAGGVALTQVGRILAAAPEDLAEHG